LGFWQDVWHEKCGFFADDHINNTNEESGNFAATENDSKFLGNFSQLKLIQQMIYDVVIMMLARQCQMRTIIDLPDE